MEGNEPVKKITAPAKASRVWIAALVFMVLLILLTFFVVRERACADPNGQGGTVSQATPVPWDLLTEDPSSSALPSASPYPTSSSAPVTQITKTAVIVNNEPIFVLASKQAADELIRNVEIHFLSFGGMPDNAVTELMTPMTTAVAGKNDETTPYDEAFAYLTGPNTPLIFRTKAVFAEEVLLPCDVSIINDDQLLVGTRIVEVYGRDGLNRVYHEAHYVNGLLESDDVTETVVVVDSVEAVIRVGTMELGEDFELTPDFGAEPDVQGLLFKEPITGEILRYFGPADGFFHQGIDVLAEEGAEVRAACGGTVVAVMTRGAYGLMIEIDHGFGIRTRYSKLLDSNVSVGDSVSSGDVIGTVLGDGYTSFLHFELRINGAAYNPLKILPGIDAGFEE